MNWERLGRIFNANGQTKWMQSHAYLPTAYEIDADRIRVFLAFRDEHQVGRLGWIDVSSSDPTHAIGFSERPALDVGRPGAFDDNGVTPLCCGSRRIALAYVLCRMAANAACPISTFYRLGL